MASYHIGYNDFSALLRDHMRRGTRPEGKATKAGKLWSSKELSSRLQVTDRTVRNWTNGKTLPPEIFSIERELFGTNPDYDAERLEFRTVYDAARRRTGNLDDSTGPILPNEDASPNEPRTAADEADACNTSPLKPVLPTTTEGTVVPTKWLHDLGFNTFGSDIWELLSGRKKVSFFLVLLSPIGVIGGISTLAAPIADWGAALFFIFFVFTFVMWRLTRGENKLFYRALSACFFLLTSSFLIIYVLQFVAALRSPTLDTINAQLNNNSHAEDLRWAENNKKLAELSGVQNLLASNPAFRRTITDVNADLAVKAKEGNDVYRQALEAVNAGNFDVALTVLSSEREHFREYPDKVAARKLRAYGAIAGLVGDLPKAIDALTEALKLEPDDADSMMMLALTELGLGRLEDARLSAEKFINKGPLTDRADRTFAKLIISLTAVLKSTDVDETIRSLQEQLNNISEQAKIDPSFESWAPVFSATAETVLCGLLLLPGHHDQPLAACKSALADTKALAEKQKDNIAIKQSVAQLDLLIGKIYLRSGSGQAGLALSHFREARNIITEAQKARPADLSWRGVGADCDIAFGDFFASLSDWGNATANYKNGIDIFENLAASDSENILWLSRLFNAHTALANILAAQGDIKGAIGEYESAIAATTKVQSHLPDSRPLDHDQSLGYYNLGTEQLAEGSYKQALTNLQAALDKLKLVEAVPAYAEAAKSLRLAVLNSMGDALVGSGKAADARSTFEEAKNLMNMGPNTQKTDIHSYFGLGLAEAILDVSSSNNSADSFEAGFATISQLNDTYAGTLPASLGNLFGAAEHSIAAILTLQEQRYREEASEDRAYGVASLNGIMAQLQVWQGRGLDALPYLRRRIEIQSTLALLYRDDEDTQDTLAVALQAFGRVVAELPANKRTSEILDEAKRALLKEEQIFRKLADNKPSDLEWQNAVAIAHVDLGDLLSSDGEFVQARMEFEAGVYEMEAVSFAEPHNEEWRNSLFADYERVEVTLDKLGDKASVLKLHKRELSAIERLVESDSANANLKAKEMGQNRLLAMEGDDALVRWKKVGEYLDGFGDQLPADGIKLRQEAHQKIEELSADRITAGALK